MSLQLYGCLDESLQQMAMPYTSKYKHAVLSIGIVSQSMMRTFGYGNITPFGTSSYGNIIYEIGSLTKVFTTSLLSLLIKRNVVRLEDSIGLYEDSLSNAHPITLRHLASHTSGLPSVSFIKALQNRFDKRISRDPYCIFDVKETLAYIQKISSKRVGKKFRYSNEGMGMLGRIIAKVMGTDLEEALIEHICQPLGMKDTTISLSSEQRGRLIPGYAGKDIQQPELVMKDFAGAGALRSTVSDLLWFLASHMNMQQSESLIDEALHYTYKQYHSLSKDVGVGLGWIIDHRTGCVWHNGSTHGYSSFMGFIPKKQLGVVILSNYRPKLWDDTLESMGDEILKLMQTK
ncbi:serine hydrolase domain-containing protein [Paenibacillus lentus]|uniref:Class A beta-lactamase-related serine hydrolase n=1 Tax=Paenibacillus lentus TaxID=1338368 RepID=A0A3S8RYS2_9BACL|nr:serine hydrolase domain-containing protein [Paenibacillus lentus]AZK48059.1 class A beta-lactamase-related serine hydrolase [Paenibacillus lentus]